MLAEIIAVSTFPALFDVSLQKITPPNGTILPFTSGLIFEDLIFPYALLMFQDIGTVVIATLPKIL